MGRGTGKANGTESPKQSHQSWGEGVMQSLCAERGGQARGGHHKGCSVEADDKGGRRGAESGVFGNTGAYHWLRARCKGSDRAKIIPLSMAARNSRNKNKVFKRGNTRQRPGFKAAAGTLVGNLLAQSESPLWGGA